MKPKVDLAIKPSIPPKPSKGDEEMETSPEASISLLSKSMEEVQITEPRSTLPWVAKTNDHVRNAGINLDVEHPKDREPGFGITCFHCGSKGSKDVSKPPPAKTTDTDYFEEFETEQILLFRYIVGGYSRRVSLVNSYNSDNYDRVLSFLWSHGSSNSSPKEFADRHRGVDWEGINEVYRGASLNRDRGVTRLAANVLLKSLGEGRYEVILYYWGGSKVHTVQVGRDEAELPFKRPRGEGDDDEDYYVIQRLPGYIVARL